jgi:hypothetical protein
MVFWTKKGYTIKDLVPLALMFVVATIALSVGADILARIQSGQSAGYAYNVTTAGLTGMGTLGNYLPTIALVIAASVVIGILVYSFMGGR